MTPESITAAGWQPISNGFNNEHDYRWSNFRSRYDDRIVKILKKDHFGYPLATEFFVIDARFDDLAAACAYLAVKKQQRRPRVIETTGCR